MKKIFLAAIAALVVINLVIEATDSSRVWGQQESKPDQSSMVAVIVTLTAKPGEEQAVEERMAKFATQCIEREPGTLMYTIIKDDDGVRTMEIYKDQEAFRAHGVTEHHDENVRILGPKVESADIKLFKMVNHPTR